MTGDYNDGSGQVTDEGYVIHCELEIRVCNKYVHLRGATGERIRPGCRARCSCFLCVSEEKEMLKPVDNY